MSWSVFQFTSDKDLDALYRRTLTDVIWLEQMTRECGINSPARKHYSAQLEKEENYLSTIEQELDARAA
jgi:hypothetical protein